MLTVLGVDLGGHVYRAWTDARGHSSACLQHPPGARSRHRSASPLSALCTWPYLILPLSLELILGGYESSGAVFMWSFLAPPDLLSNAKPHFVGLSHLSQGRLPSSSQPRIFQVCSVSSEFVVRFSLDRPSRRRRHCFRCSPIFRHAA